MPGILVGIDGSGHSQRALEWAMKEASLRNAPVTVLAVHPTARGFFSDNSSFPQDKELTDRARDAAPAGSPICDSARPALRSRITRTARCSLFRLRTATEQKIKGLFLPNGQWFQAPYRDLSHGPFGQI